MTLKAVYEKKKYIPGESYYPILYPIFYNSSRGLSADHYFGTILYL